MQVLIIRILRQGIRDRFADPLPHFTGRCLGERDNQKTVYVHRLFRVHYVCKDARNKYSSLAAACGGADKDVVVPLIYYLLLVWCPLHLFIAPILSAVVLLSLLVTAVPLPSSVKHLHPSSPLNS